MRSEPPHQAWDCPAFQRHFNRPSTLGGYLTDTMLWIYLVQLAIIAHILPWLQNDRSPWLASSVAGMAAVTAVSLVLFEMMFGRPR